MRDSNNNNNNNNKNRGRAIRILRKEFKQDDEERLSACAYILFKNKNSVEKALQKTGMVFNNRHITITAEDKLSKSFDPKTSAYLGNINYTTSDEDIWEFFINNNINNIKRVRIIRDRETGNAKGFGYVEFENITSLEKGILLRGNIINGRDVRICHVQRSKDPALAQLLITRRQKRKEENRKIKKYGVEGAAKLEEEEKEMERNNNNIKNNNNNIKNNNNNNNYEERPSWMGTTVNPRKKLPKDLRQLIQTGEVITKEKKKLFARKS
eukprot:Tbor_TRINITY_DN5351_c5_g1::TRINITY_DN5351_c5_g1_i1::g.3843::m.3843/K14837/NOP12; nucleolar protein 12